MEGALQRVRQLKSCVSKKADELVETLGSAGLRQVGKLRQTLGGSSHIFANDPEQSLVGQALSQRKRR